jgi:hypothetical protein
MDKMKKLPIGIQTFRKIIEDDYLYVDKTKEIYQLVSKGGPYYFLSRPRRFGKSLLVSTLFELFSGQAHLFKGLWIEDKWPWYPYPVIHLDFTSMAYESGALLKRSLEDKLTRIASQFAVSLTSVNYKTQFEELIEKISVKYNAKAVLLIDEYDKPIIDNISDRKTGLINRDILRDFYSVIKAADQYLKFVFITGVSKFSRVSVFSGLNNLNDITIGTKYTSICGYSQAEIDRYFPFNRIARQKIKTWYNGYSWDGQTFLYNPFSILLYVEKNRFENYWFSSATPAFLIDLIKEKQFPIMDFENIEADSSVFETFDIDHIEVISLLFQTGYLTIKRKNENSDGITYSLTYPNQEVRESLLKHLLKSFTANELVENLKVINSLKRDLVNHHLEGIFHTIHSVFASIPYNMFVANSEGFYHSIVYLLFRLAGVKIFSEQQTNQGRMDAYIELKDHIYIFEFKLGSSQMALQQIEAMNYADSFKYTNKFITLVGAGIDPQTRNILPFLSKSI